MKKTIKKIKYKDITNIVKKLVKEQQDDIVVVSPEEFKQYLEYVSYKGDAISRFPKFKGKKVVVDGDLNLGGTPLDSLGPLYKVNGTLNISNTKVSSLGILTNNKWTIRYWDTPLEKIEKKRERNRKLAELESKREDDEWSIENQDPVGLRAQALLVYLSNNEDIEILDDETKQKISEIKQKIEDLDEQVGNETNEDRKQELVDEISELENELSEYDNYVDVYSLYPNGNHYDLVSFIPLIGGLENQEYAVGNESEVESSAIDYVKQLIDDVGIKGFNQSFVEGHIDTDRLISYVDNESYVRDSLEDYFDDSDKELSSEQTQRIEELKNTLEEKQEESNELDMTLPESKEIYDELQTEMDDILSEIDDIESSPDGDIPEHLIQEKIDALNDDIVRDPMSYIKDRDLDIGDFVDEDEFAQAVVDSDGYGQLSSYDGSYDTIKIDGVYYYVFRTN